jgi:hypothetical protein
MQNVNQNIVIISELYLRKLVGVNQINYVFELNNKIKLDAFKKKKNIIKTNTQVKISN